MKQLFFTLTLLFIAVQSFSQSLMGFGKISSQQNVSVNDYSQNSYGEFAVVGTFYDSINVDIQGGSYMLYGGSSATNVHNSFIVTYDSYGTIMGAVSLGTATDSIRINGVSFTDSDLVITGTFSGNIDFSGGIFSPTFLNATGGNDAFAASYSSNCWVNYAHILETTGTMAVGTDIKHVSWNEYVVVGYFNGTIDLDPTGSNVDYVSTGNLNGFVAYLSPSMLVVGGHYEGNGNIMPMAIGWNDNLAELVITGKFDTDVNMKIDGDAFTLIYNTNGGYDAFVASYDVYSFGHYWSNQLGGTGNDVGKALMAINDEIHLLVDYENSVEFNPAGSSMVLNSSGATDVAVVKYLSADGTAVFAKSFGNAGVNLGSTITNTIVFGGRENRGGPMYVPTDFTFSMTYSGTVDFDPSATGIANSTSTNTPINSAIVDLDSLGNYLMHGSIQAKNILGISVNDWNDVIIAGNFSGTNVDVLPYDSVALLSNTINAGYVTLYNRCHITANGLQLVGPYECNTCSAKLEVVNVSNYVSPLDYSWGSPNENYYNYDAMATGVCPDSLDYYFVDIYDGWACYHHDTIWVRPAPQGSAPDFTLNLTHTSCGTNFGTAVSTPVNPLGNITWLWSNGSTTTMADSLTAGTYTVQMLDDSIMCYLEKPFVINNSNGPTISLVSSTNPSCGNINDGMIDISVSGGAPPYTFLWNNGETTEDISNLSGGNYSVTVTDVTGCENYYCVDLTQGTAIVAYYDDSYGTDCLLSNGAIMIASEGGALPHTYQWSANAGSSTNDTITNLAAGVYTLTVTDNDGCMEDFYFAVSDYQGPTAWADYITDPDCIGTSGSIDMYSWSPWGTINYNWSTGDNTEDVTGLSSGNYWYEFNDLNGCISAGNITLNEILPLSPIVCMVTTDSTATQNVVVFDKGNTPEADYYKIYREGYCNVNSFGVVGIVDHDSLSVFYDTVVNSDTRTWRYYVTAVDTCGNESLPSEIHRTIHLTIEFDADTNLFLDWSEYLGMDILGYKIYRKQPSGSNFDFVDSVGPLQTNYLDTIDFTPYSTVEYFIDAVPLTVCTAYRAYNQNEARSNHASRNVPAANTNALNDEIRNESVIQLYPNPADDRIRLNINNKDTWTIHFIDHIGKVVMNGTINNNAEFSMKELSPGVYFIRLMNQSTNETQVVKLVIAR